MNGINRPARLDPATRVRLSLAEYGADFNERLWLQDGHDSWKLERRQEFREPGSPSWEAFAAGKWELAVELCEAQRSSLPELVEQAERHRSYFHRVRVVSLPVTPYLQWELHYIRVRAATGWERIRVVDAARLRDLEQDGTLPELVTVCGRTLYEVLYTGDGVCEGADRHTDPGVIAAYEDLIKALFAEGDDLESFFRDQIAPLPPP